MKKIIILLFFIQSILFSENLTNKELEYLQNNNFNIYVNTWEPYIKVSTDESGKKIFSGVAVEYFEAITKDVPINYNLIDANNFTNLLKNLKTDPNAMTLSSSKTKDKESYALFTEPYVSYPIAVMTKRDKPFISSLDKFQNKVIAVGNKFTAHKTLEKYYPNIKLKTVKNTLEGLELLMKDEVYGVADILPSVINLQNKYGLNEIKISGLTNEEIFLRMLVNKNLAPLQKILNKLIVNNNIKLEDLESYFQIKAQLSKELLLNSKEKEFIDKKDTYNVCSPFDVYPFSDVLDGKVTGIIGEILDEVTKKIEIKFSGIKTTSDLDLDNKIQNNECDLISIVPFDNSGYSNIKTSKSLIKQKLVLVSGIDHDFISNNSDFENSKIYTTSTFLKDIVQNKYPKLNIVVEKNKDKIIEDLSTDRHGYFLASDAESSNVISNYGYKNYKVIYEFDDIEFNISIGINDNLPLLVDILNKSINNIPDEKIHEIFNKYEKIRYEVSNEINEFLLLIVGISLIFITVLFYLLNKIKKNNLVLSNETKRAIENERLAIESKLQLVKAKEELTVANEMKSQFLANMSHEIRTPLNGILGITDILMDKNDLDKQVKENLEIIQSSSMSLRSIIDDILDFTKIQAGKFKIVNKKFSLSEMIKEMKNLYLPLAKQKNLEFNVTIDENIEDTIIGDEIRIKQIIGNLVSNAIKFTHKGSVSLSVKLAKKQGKFLTLKFEIEDTGIGMSDEVKSRIFNEFVQGEFSNTKEYKGTGLGLVISKSLVEIMNGDLKYNSVENIGTTFIVELTLEYSEDKIIQKNDTKVLKKLKESKSALVAEDVVVNQIVIEKKLTKIGFEVVFAKDGLEALQMAKENSYDIIFMDLQMPNMDGFDASKRIREFDKNIPIIALSAAVLDNEKNKTFEAGMNYHVAKPIDDNNLYEVIEKYFELISEEIVLKETKKETKTSHNNQLDVYSEILQNIDNDFDEDTILNILEVFKKQYENFNKEIKEINDDDFKSYIHKLKGSSGNLGLHSIYNLCLNIEICKNEDEKEKYLISLIEKMKELFEMIDEKLSNINIVDTYDETEIELVVEELIYDLDNYNYVEEIRMKKLVNSLKNNYDKAYLDKILKSYHESDNKTCSKLLLNLSNYML